MPAALRLRKDQERRLNAGHCWVYSNEVDIAASPLKDLAAGEPVALISSRGKWLAWGYANPHSLICARVVSRDRDRPLDRSLLADRLRTALALREDLYPEPFYRLVFGESDALPGLVVDRYADLLVVQLTTAGMERLRSEIVAALDEVLSPGAILLRNDAAVRRLEGLDAYVEPVKGEIPDRVEVREGGCRFRVSVTEGQKTGWFFDQARNRDRMLAYLRGRRHGARVLDVFSYVGAWGVRALAAGADRVLAVDSSDHALEMAAANAGLNAVDDRLQVRRGDAFSVLKELRQEGERYDVVVVDPPAFIKRRKDVREGIRAYRRLNESALSLLSDAGMLITASCSFHMDRETLLRTVQQSARDVDRGLQLLEQGQQGPDHPIHPAIPETAYLKACYLRVLPGT